jgi:flagellin-specific chaperone FliS
MTAGTSYQQVSISTSDPGSLVVQLFDGAGRFIARARKALAAGDQPTFAY